MKKKIVVLLVLLIAGFAVWRLLHRQGKGSASAPATYGPAPAPVVVATAALRDMPVEIHTFGTVEASTTVTIRAQVTGMLSEVCFEEGQDVAAGQVLFRIDARPFEAALHQAEAALARSEAQRANAAREARRANDLQSRGFMSEQDRDQAATALQSAEAAAKSDAAAVESARILVDDCTIRSPLSGRAGRRLADAGNLVNANASALVTINRVCPVSVVFAVPQQDMALLRGWRTGPGVPVTVSLPEAAASEGGRLTFLDNSVDRATGTLTVKAEFANEDRRLWPGQFVDVRMRVGTETHALVVPFRAVQNGQQGTYLFVVADGHAESRLVKIGRSVGEDSVIASGLRAGERVVTEGQQRLGPGVAVSVRAPDERAPDQARRAAP